MVVVVVIVVVGGRIVMMLVCLYTGHRTAVYYWLRDLGRELRTSPEALTLRFAAFANRCMPKSVIVIRSKPLHINFIARQTGNRILPKAEQSAGYAPNLDAEIDRMNAEYLNEASNVSNQNKSLAFFRRLETAQTEWHAAEAGDFA